MAGSAPAALTNGPRRGLGGPTATLAGAPASDGNAPPVGVSRVDPGRIDPAEEAASQVRQTYEQQGATAAANQLAELTEGQPPARVDAIVEASSEVIGDISNDLARQSVDAEPGSRAAGDVTQGLVALAAVNGNGGEATRQTLSRQLAFGIGVNREGAGIGSGRALPPVLASAFETATQVPGGVGLVAGTAEALVGTPAYGARDQVGDIAGAAVQSAQEAQASAAGTRAALDSELNTALLERPYLSDEQRAAYIEEFQSRHSEEYAAADEADARLGNVLENAGGALASLAGRRPDHAESIVSAVEAAAATSPRAALEFAAASDRLPEGQFDERIGTVVETATASAIAEAPSTAGGFDDAINHVDDLLGRIRQTRVGRALGSTISSAEEAVTALRGGPEAIEDYLSGRTASSVSSFALSLRGASLVAAVGAGVVNGDRVGEIAATLGEHGAAFVDEAVRHGGSLARFLDNASGGHAGDIGRIAGRLAPLFGAAADAYAAVDAFRDARENGGAGRWVSVAGNAISAIGSLVSLGVVTAPVGKLIQAVGLGVGLVGQGLTSILDAGDRRREHNDILRGVFERYPPDGVPPSQQDAVVDRLVNDHRHIDDIVQRGGLSAPELYGLLAEYPDVDARTLSDATRGLAFGGFQGSDLVDAIGQVHANGGPGNVAFLAQISRERIHGLDGSREADSPTADPQVRDSVREILAQDLAEYFEL